MQRKRYNLSRGRLEEFERACKLKGLDPTTVLVQFLNAWVSHAYPEGMVPTSWYLEQREKAQRLRAALRKAKGGAQ